MRIEDILAEARRNPHLNKKIDARDKIRKYLSKGTHYFHFSNLSMVSLHPEPYYKTPMGIYAYTPDEIREAIDGNDGDIDNLPYATDSDNIYVLKAKGNIVKLLDYNNYEEDSKKVMEFFLNYIRRNYGDGGHIKPSELILKEFIYNNRNKFSNDGIAIWKLVYDIIRKFIKKPSSYYELERYDLGERKVNDARITHSVFHKVLGWDVVIDEGSGTIHPNEPSQVIFFKRGALDVVELIKNTSTSAKNKRKFAGRSEGVIRRELEAATKILTGSGVLRGSTISTDINDSQYNSIIEYFETMTKLANDLNTMDMNHSTYQAYDHPTTAIILSESNIHRLIEILMRRGASKEDLFREYKSNIDGEALRNTISLFGHGTSKVVRDELYPSTVKTFKGFLTLFTKFK